MKGINKRESFTDLFGTHPEDPAASGIEETLGPSSQTELLKINNLRGAAARKRQRVQKTSSVQCLKKRLPNFAYFSSYFCSNAIEN